MTKHEILIGLSESERTKFGKEDFALQSFPQKVFSSIWAIESEVNNGGFSQFFLNSSAETMPFVADALDTIGALRTAAICRRAVERAFPDGLPATPDEVSSAAAEWARALLLSVPHPTAIRNVRTPHRGVEWGVSAWMRQVVWFPLLLNLKCVAQPAVPEGFDLIAIKPTPASELAMEWSPAPGGRFSARGVVLCQHTF